jgi:hypothetical protein
VIGRAGLKFKKSLFSLCMFIDRRLINLCLLAYYLCSIIKGFMISNTMRRCFGGHTRIVAELNRKTSVSVLNKYKCHPLIRSMTSGSNGQEAISTTSTVGMVDESPKLTPRQRRIQANIEVYNARKNNPLLINLKPLKLPKNYDENKSPFEDILRAVVGYEKAGQCRNIYNLCVKMDSRDKGDMLRQDGCLLLRNMIISELKLNRNDLAMELMKQYGEKYFRDNLISTTSSHHQYADELHAFIKLLCQYGNMETVTYLTHKFDLIGDGQIEQLIKSREYNGEFEKNIVASVSAKLASMAEDLNSNKIGEDTLCINYIYRISHFLKIYICPSTPPSIPCSPFLSFF